MNTTPRDSADAESALDRLAEDSKDRQRASLPSKEVRVAGGGLMLGNADNLAFDEATFAQILHEQIDATKWGSVEYLLRTYPDIAMALLLYGPSEHCSVDELRLVAGSMDSIWSDAQPHEKSVDSWAAYVISGQKKASHDQMTFFDARLQFYDHLTNNQPRAALKLDLVRRARNLNSTIAEIEGARLNSLAHSLEGDHEEAVQELQRALEVARKAMPIQASRLNLLLADSLRHLKRQNDWMDAWQQAVTIESETASRVQFFDPSFWKQAAFQRPVRTEWPQPVIDSFRQMLKRYHLEFPEANHGNVSAEPIVWAMVGMQSLHRHESQNAILALKKAESLVQEASLKNELILQQARAMIDGGQAGPASPVLYRLTSQPGNVSDRSRAVLGALKLQHGSLDQGLNLLRSAMKDTNDWPEEERLRAESDYALALLIAGEEQKGLELQEQTFHAFAERKMFNHAAQSLANRARYFEAKKRSAEYTSALDRMTAYEADPTSVH